VIQLYIYIYKKKKFLLSFTHPFLHTLEKQEACRADAVLLGGRRLDLEKKMAKRTTWHLWGPAPESLW